MSRLRRGVHTVTVRPMVETVGARGGVVQSLGDPVEVQVNVQPVSTSEVESLSSALGTVKGLSVGATYRVKYFPREHGGVPWPGGAYSRITWQGREYDQQGEGLVSSMSSVTGHVKVIMTARSSAVK